MNIYKLNNNIYKTRVTTFRLYALSDNEIRQIKNILRQELLDKIGDNREIIMIEYFNRQASFRKNDIVLETFGEKLIIISIITVK